ncbi:MAG: hypothetical protein B7X67_10080 [Rhizobiales bacterium 39-66-18]|nr:MAG: hypothetical protein B7X67_10080 [Rhizobiales bacterium 39-66-18]
MAASPMRDDLAAARARFSSVVGVARVHAKLKIEMAEGKIAVFRKAADRRPPALGRGGVDNRVDERGGRLLRPFRHAERGLGRQQTQRIAEQGQHAAYGRVGRLII